MKHVLFFTLLLAPALALAHGTPPVVVNDSYSNWTNAGGIYNSIEQNIGSFPRNQQAGYGTVPVLQSVVGSIAIPAVTNVYQGVGIAGYAKTADSGTAAIGSFGSGALEADGASAWGGNTIVGNNNMGAVPRTGYNNFNVISHEADVYISRLSDESNPTGGNAVGYYAVIDGDITAAVPGRASAFHALAPYGVKWKHVLTSEAGAADTGIEFRQVSKTGESDAQAIVFVGRDSGATEHSSTIHGDSNGNIIANPKLAVGTESFVADTALTVYRAGGINNEAPLGLTHGGYSHRAGPISNGSFVVYRATDNTGVYLPWGGTAWVGTSDARLKEGVRPLEAGLAEITRLRPVAFRWKAGPETEHAGLIAQEVEPVLPEIVSDGPDGMKGVNYAMAVLPLINAVKELNARVEKLESGWFHWPWEKK